MYVFFDQGGELLANPDVNNVFLNWHYEIHPTRTNLSHQNGPMERAHGSVGDHGCAHLTGANLSIRFWLHAFIYHLRIWNALVPVCQDSSCIFQSTRKKENLDDF